MQKGSPSPARSSGERGRGGFGLLLGALALAAPRVAVAQESHFHAQAGLGHAVGDPLAHELAWGGQAALAYELRLAKAIGVEVMADAYDLAQASAPIDPAFAKHDQGFGADGLLGVRLRPFASMARGGLWVEAAWGAGVADSVLRPVFEARLGFDFLRFASLDWEAGPFVGYTQVFQPSDSLRLRDAHVLWLGIHLDLAAHASARPDHDGDGVFDDEDACPDGPGVRTADPQTSGCPSAPRLDRDADGIPDGEDACLDVQGVRSSNPRTNGCPPEAPDRDHDGVPDTQDACLDVPGVRTFDPKTNGCPLPPDRDRDGVLDADDACPDVPGVHTGDPKTSGCPGASDLVRVEGDKIILGDVIHFDTASPRVRHVSWPIVKKMADYIQANPEIEEVDIEGHADEVGTSEYNLDLSRERASSVLRLLVHFGVDPSRLTEHAHGQSRPREPGHDEKAHRENRRVEFTITRARAGTTPAQPRAPGAR